MNILSTIESTRLILDSWIQFFLDNGEIGLFFYAILETITPLIGIELIMFPIITNVPERWWIISINVAFANTIGAYLVYRFMASKDNRFFNKIISKKNQIYSEKLFNRYGFWAIFIFALTPLPFFIILFTASVAKMRFTHYLFATFFSRGTRFFLTTYAFSVLGTTDNLLLWLTLIGISVSVVFVSIQKWVLKRINQKLE